MNTFCPDHNECSTSALQKAEMICKDRKLSFTPIRKKILSLLWQNGHNPTKAYDLLEKLKLDDPDAKPVTIYRALDFLIENHLIHKLNSQNSFIGCNHPTNPHNCIFLICDKCGNVNECCDINVIENIHQSLGKQKFQVEHIVLEIHGKCYEC